MKYKPNKKELYDLYFSQHKTMKEIGTIFGLSRKSISLLMNKYDLCPRKYRCAVLAPPKNVLYELYNTHMLTLKQIGSLYGVGKKAVNAWFKKYNLKKITNAQRKYHHLRKIPLTKLQHEFVIGTMLGDGSLEKSGNFYRLEMGHGLEQLEYLLWKKNILNNITNTIYKYKQKTRNSTIVLCKTVAHQDFNKYGRLFLENNKKVIKKDISNHLTPFAMAVWFMDDGSAKPYCVKISTEGFTKEENYILRDAIYVNFNISSKVCEYSKNNKKYYYLSFNKENTIKLCALIEKFIIPSMMYKIPFRSSTTEREALGKQGGDTV